MAPIVYALALLDVYHKLFPEAQQDEQWQLLVNGLYRTIAASDTRLFPVFNKVVIFILYILSTSKLLHCLVLDIITTILFFELC